MRLTKSLQISPSSSASWRLYKMKWRWRLAQREQTFQSKQGYRQNEKQTYSKNIQRQTIYTDRFSTFRLFFL